MEEQGRGQRLLRVVSAVFYWVAVLTISLAFVVGLVLFFESRDQSSLDEGEGDRSSQPGQGGGGPADGDGGGPRR